MYCGNPCIIEQWLSDLGLLALQFGCLTELNAALMVYGPESFDKPRVTIDESKKRTDESIEEELTRTNISVASFTGTEFQSYSVY